jgi:rhamnogalacturonyl hydrolase YesR
MNMRKLLITFFVFSVVSLQAKQWTGEDVKDLIKKVNTYWQTNNPAEVRAFWDNAAYHTGNMEVIRLLSGVKNEEFKSFLDYSLRWAEHNKWKGATEPDPQKWKYKQYGEGQDYVLFGDWQICFQTYIDLYNLEVRSKRLEVRGKRLEVRSKKFEVRVKRAKEVMGYEADSKVHDYWWWADALYMVMPVMTKMYKLTGDEKYLDKLYENICYCDSIMLDKETGLYFRDGKYVYPKHKTANGKKDFWARGDGWVLAGLAKVLQDMPKTYRYQPFFAEKFVRLANAVMQIQQPEGHWTRSMMDPDQAPGYETSGTAFFCYGLLWGVNNGYLPKKTFQPAIEKAWYYLSTIALQADGKVGYVQPIGERAIPGQRVDANSQANFGVGAFLLAACEYYRYLQAGQVTLTFQNGSNWQRQEVAEVDLQAVCQQLGIGIDEPLVIENRIGQEVGYQKTYDGKLLVFVSLHPHGNATYTVSKGKPAEPKAYVRGKVYPTRMDDMAWENDRAAYRFYGPALQKTGERSFGTDVWVKNTPELVVEDRYTKDREGNVMEDSLRRAGQKVALSDIDRNTSFHLDHGNGMDAYGVGPSLGCGAPALMDNGKLVFPYCYKTCQIRDNGPLRFTAELTYNPTADGITEHRLVSLDRGSHFNCMTVWYDGIPKPVALASGVVLHSDEGLVLGKDYVQYADPTDRPELHQSQVYVATLFPEGVSETKMLKGELNHGIGIVKNYQGAPYTYYFGSAWSLYDVLSQAQWQVVIDEFLANLRQPLTYTITQ